MKAVGLSWAFDLYMSDFFTAIMAPDIIPVLDPADHALMLSPEQLKNQGSKTSNVSFLRKSQYMNAQNARAGDPLVRTNPRTQKPVGRSASLVEAQLARDDKENIRRQVQKGFDTAFPQDVRPDTTSAPLTAVEKDAWENPTHPDNVRLKPVAYYPIVPDLEALPDQGAYASIKFDKAPLPSRRGKRDDRVDVALLRAFPDPQLKPRWDAKKAAYQSNPDAFEEPGPEPVVFTYEIPIAEDGVDRLHRILNESDQDKNNPDLWAGFNDVPEDGEQTERHIEYTKIRSYPNNITQDVNSGRFFALSLFDPDTAPDTSRLKPNGRAAYIYPISKRKKLRADRSKVGRAPPPLHTDDKDPTADWHGTALRFVEPSIMTQYDRLNHKVFRDETYRAEFEKVSELVDVEAAKLDQADNAAEEQQGDGEDEPGDRDAVDESRAVNGHVNGDDAYEKRESRGRNGQSDDEDDADADADVDVMDER